MNTTIRLAMCWLLMVLACWAAMAQQPFLGPYQPVGDTPAMPVLAEDWRELDRLLRHIANTASTPGKKTQALETITTTRVLLDAFHHDLQALAQHEAQGARLDAFTQNLDGRLEALDNDIRAGKTRVARGELRAWLLGDTILDVEALPGFDAMRVKQDSPLATPLTHVPAHTKAPTDFSTVMGADVIAVFNYVQQHIELDPAFGWKRSPGHTFDQRVGTAADQAALLIDALGDLGLSARFAYGRVTLSLSRLTRAYGVSTPAATLAILAGSGTPFTRVDDNHVTLDHVWVETFIPFDNRRGSGADRSGARWVPLDPSLGRLTVQSASLSPTLLSFDVDTLLDDYLTTADAASSPRDWFTEQINTAIAPASETDLRRTYNQDEPNLNLLRAALPYRSVQRDGVGTSMPDALVQWVNLELLWRGTRVLDASLAAANLSGEDVILHFEPYNSADRALLEEYGHLYQVPAHLIRVVPVLQNAKQVLARGTTPLPLGHALDLTIQLPGQALPDSSIITSGGFRLLAFDAGPALSSVAAGPVRDTEEAPDLLGRLADRYLRETAAATRDLNQWLHVRPFQPGLALVQINLDLDLTVAGGVVTALTVTGASMDAPPRVQHVIADDGSDTHAMTYQRLFDLHAAFMEATVFDQAYAWSAVSTISAFRTAIQGGLGAVVLDETNLATLLPGLGLPQREADHITSLVQLGQRVLILHSDLSDGSWTGRAYFALNDDTGGLGAYLTRTIAGADTNAPLPPAVFLGLTAPGPIFDSSDILRLTPAFVRVNPELQFTEVKAGQQAEVDFPIYAYNRYYQPLPGVVKQTRVAGLGQAEALPSGEETGPEPARLTYTAGTSTYTNALAKIITLPHLDSPDPLQVGREQIQVTMLGDFLSFYDTLVLPHEPDHMRFDVSLSESTQVEIAWVTQWSASIHDRYGNPLANEAIEFADISGLDCEATQFKTEETPEWLPQNRTYSDFAGLATARVRTGLKFLTTYDYTISHVDSDLSLRKTYRTKPNFGTRYTTEPRWTIEPEPNVLFTGTTSDDSGVFQYMIPPGSTTTYKITPEFYRVISNSDGCFEQQPEEDYVWQLVSPIVSDGDLAEVTDLGGGEFELTIHKPGQFAVGHVLAWARADAARGHTSYPIIHVASPGLSLSAPEVPLDGAGRLVEPLLVELNMEGAGVRFRQLKVELYEGSQLFTTRLLPSVEYPGLEFALLPAGARLDVNKRYRIEVDAIEFEPFPPLQVDPFYLDLKPGDFRLEGKVVSSDGMTEDTHGFVALKGTCGACPEPADLRLLVTNELPMATSFYLNNQLIFEDRFFQPGVNTITYDAAELGVGQHEYRFEAEDGRGNIHTASGQISVFSQKEDTLPVGSTLVNGVNLRDGSLTIQRQDFNHAGRGPSMSLTRTYSSKSAALDNPMGIGWSHNWDVTIAVDCDGNVRLSGGDGSGQSFCYSGTEYIPQPGYHGSLEGDAASGFSFYTKGRVHYRYNGDTPSITAEQGTIPKFALEYVEDTFGNRVSLAYDVEGDVTAIFEGDARGTGRELLLTYAKDARERKRLTRIDAPGGVVMAYTYNDEGQLIAAERNPNGQTVRRETYNYTPPFMKKSTIANLRIQPGAIWFSGNQLLSITNPDGYITRYEYFTRGASGGDLQPGVLIGDDVPFWEYVSRVIEPEGLVTHYGYAPDTQAVVRIGSGQHASETRYEFNRYGAPLTIEGPLGTRTMTWAEDDVLKLTETNEAGQHMIYAYDANANMTRRETQADGLVTVETWTYDTTYNVPLTYRDAMGNLTTWEIDPNSGSTLALHAPEGQSTRYAYDTNGDRIATWDANGNLTATTYDQYGFPRTVTLPDNNVVTTVYDVQGRVVSKTDNRNLNTINTYNALDTLISQRSLATNSGGIDVAHSQITPMGKVGQITDGAVVTTLTFDGLGRVTSEAIERGDHRMQTTVEQYDHLGNRVIETIDGRRFEREFDAAGRLLRETVNNRLVEAYTYWPGTALPATVTNHHGAVTTFEYDGLLRLTKETLPTGHSREYTYDRNGNILTQTDANGNLSAMRYDGLNRVIARTNPLGQETLFDFDPNNNLVREEVLTTGAIVEHNYDGLNRIIRTSQNSAAGQQVTTYEFQQAGLIRIINPPEDAPITETYNQLSQRIAVEQNGVRTEYRYNANDEMIAVINPAPYAPTTITYDHLHRPIAQTDPRGFTSTTRFDAFGNVRQAVDARGIVTEIDYDALNRPLRITSDGGTRGDLSIAVQYEETPLSVTRIATTPEGNRVATQFDARERLVRIDDDLRGTLTQTWDGENLREIRDFRNIRTAFAYDALNRITRQDVESYRTTWTYDDPGRRITITDPRGIETTQAYDVLGNMLRTVRAGITLESHQYDLQNRVVRSEDAAGVVSTTQYQGNGWVNQDSLGFITTQYRDFTSMGHPQTVDDGGVTTRFTYDYFGQVLTRTNGAGETWQFAYDGVGNRIAVTEPTSTGPQTTTMTYDVRNQPASIQQPLGKTTYNWSDDWTQLTITDPDTVTSYLRYDRAARLVSVTQPGHETMQFTYDGNDNLRTQTDSLGTVTFTYDGRDLPILEAYTTDRTGLTHIRRRYDGNGNLISVTQDGSNGSYTRAIDYDHLDRPTNFRDSRGYNLSVGYFDNGNRSRIVDPEGQVTRYTYNDANLLATARIWDQGTARYDYYPNGRLQQVDLPNETVTTYGYDAADRLSQILHTYADGNITAFNLSYYPGGDRATLSESRSGMGVWDTTYYYDNNRRLTAWERGKPNGSIRRVDLTLSPGGDRLHELETEIGTAPAYVRERQYNGYLNHMVLGFSETVNENNTLVTDRTVSYAYDRNGNRERKTDLNNLSNTSHRTDMTWDARNRLLTVLNNGQESMRFTYDDLDRRVRKTGDWRDPNPVQYVWDELSVINEYVSAAPASAKRGGPAQQNPQAVVDDLGRLADPQLSAMLEDPIAVAARGPAGPRFNPAIANLPGLPSNARSAGGRKPAAGDALDQVIDRPIPAIDQGQLDSKQASTPAEREPVHATDDPSADPSSVAAEPDEEALSPLLQQYEETDRSAAGRDDVPVDRDQPLCLTLDHAAVMLADSPPATTKQRIMNQFEAAIAKKFQSRGRWSATATDGAVSGHDTMTLTVSFVPDGTAIPDPQGEGGAEPSVLFQTLDAAFPGGRAAWQDQVRQALAAWSAWSGITFILVEDDGAAYPESSGELASAGTTGRGDIRIAMRTIDGTPLEGNVLGINYFPNGGDLVLDAADVAFFTDPNNSFRTFRNILGHEHGHGLGLAHVDPLDGTKLMESKLSTAFDGPQEDDIRAIQFLYGDPLEANPTAATAADLGGLTPNGTTSLSRNDLALETEAAVDWYRIDIAPNAIADIQITPIGSRYQQGPEDGALTTVNALFALDLSFALYAPDGQLVARANRAPRGEPESLQGLPLPRGGGTYRLAVASTGTGAGPQRYQLDLNTTFFDGPNQRLSINDADLAADDVVAFPDTLAGGSSQITLRLHNDGNQPLVLGGGEATTAFVLAGSHPDDFAVNPPNDTTIAAGDSRDITLHYTPSISGERWASLTILTNDSKQSPFQIYLRGSDGVGTPTVAFILPQADTAEGQTHTANLRLRTPTGAPLSVPVQVRVQTQPSADGAIAGSDFGVIDQTFTFPAGSTDGDVLPVQVPIFADATFEAAESFALCLTDAAGALIGNTRCQSITIAADSTDPLLSIYDATALESTPTDLTFDVLLDRTTDVPVQVTYTTQAGSADEGIDYTAISGTLTIPAGSLGVTLTVPIGADSTPEDNETFSLTLSDSQGALLRQAVATGTIADDDGSARGQIRASYAFGLSRLAMQDHVDGMRWVCTDPLGSTADLVANDGSLVHALTYDPYGNPETIFGDSWNRHTFTDHEYDPESGLYYAKARFYDPDLGNFTSADKWQFVDFNNAPTLNRYSYAAGNPLRFTDPTGNSAEAEDEEPERKPSLFSRILGGAKDTVVGVAKSAYNATVGTAVETVNMVHDLGMAAYSMGKYAITGEFEDFEMRSGIGKASEAGATSGELLTEMAVATVSAPVHLVEGLAEGDFEKVGENLVDTASIFMGRVKVPKISKAQKSVAKVAAKSKATPKIAAEARSGASNRAKPATKATTGDSGASKTQVAKRATRTTGKAKSTIDNAQTTARIMPEKRKAQSPDRRSENTASDGPSSCFVAGTLVRTRDGLVPIEDIAVGDEVATAHEDSGERGWSTVTRTYQRQAADIFDLQVENQAGEQETYGVTGEHPFWVVGKGWTPVAQLRLIDQLISRDGSVLRIVAKTKRQGSQTVYNLEVADTHTYHVGHQKTWVHNTCGDNTNKSAKRQNEPATPTEAMQRAKEGETYSKYETPFQPLSRKNEIKLKSKVETRNITKGEYKRLTWHKRFKKRRNAAVRDFWKAERNRLKSGEQGTRNWLPDQHDAIIKNGRKTFKGKSLEGHHIYNALDHPHIADRAWNIYPATKLEHLKRWHGGSWRNDTTGQPLNPDFPEEF